MTQIAGIPTGSLGADYGMRAAYVQAIASAGGAALLIPPQQEAGLRAIYGRIDRLLLAGGGDVEPERYGDRPTERLIAVDPERDRAELCLAAWALRDGMPILAICRGIQLLNVALGGTLIQDIPSRWPRTLVHQVGTRVPPDHPAHTVAVDPGSRLAGLLAGEPLWVNSRHHQALARIGDGLRVVARAPDGIVEAVEMDDAGAWVLGVQWHPENLLLTDETARRLFGTFVRGV